MDASILKVESDIEEVNLLPEINDAKAKCLEVSIDASSLEFWRNEIKQLRKKEEQLRNEIKQLRNKEEQPEHPMNRMRRLLQGNGLDVRPE